MFFIKVDKDTTLYDLGILDGLKLAAIPNIFTGYPELYFMFDNSRWLICQNGHRIAVDMQSIASMMTDGTLGELSLYSENDNYRQAQDMLALFEKNHIRAFMVVLDDKIVKI